MNVKKNDQVIVLSGKDKGKKGKVLRPCPRAGKVVVEGVNMVTCHSQAAPQGEPGGIVKKEAAIDACKVHAVCPKCGKPTRVGHKVIGCRRQEDVRVCKKCGADHCEKEERV